MGSTSSTQTPLERPATFADLIAIPEEDRFHEILDGELLPKEMTSGEHCVSQGQLLHILGPYFGKPNGPSRPGGWWLVPEPTILLTPHQVARPDIAGWRRDRMPQPPHGYPQRLRPDWVCEVHVQKDARRRDTLKKRRIYAEHGIPHYWLIDAQEQTLTVLRLVDGVFVDVMTADRTAGRIHAEPFDGIELSVGALFGDDPE